MFHTLHDSGVKTIYYDIIFNNPYETVEDLKESVRTILEIPPPYNFFGFNLVFFPGTELYKRAMADGLISERKDGPAPGEPLFELVNSPIHLPLSNKPSSRLYNVHYSVRKKRYYNLLLFLLTGTRIVPHGIVRFLLNHRNTFTERLPTLLTLMVVSFKKMRGRISGGA